MKLTFKTIANVLNVRRESAGTVFAELLFGDLVEVASAKAGEVWVPVRIASGLNAGREGFVRRKWLAQAFDAPQLPAAGDRSELAAIADARSTQFDHVTYGLGAKAKTWNELQRRGAIDCSGWTALLGLEMFAALGLVVKPALLHTHSDLQVTGLGKAGGRIVSGPDIGDALLQPGCLVGLDFAEYSWDRNRPLDIDHVVMIGAVAGERFATQSSSSGGGVNRVPLARWLASVAHLRHSWRMHCVDLLDLLA